MAWCDSDALDHADWLAGSHRGVRLHKVDQDFRGAAYTGDLRECFMDGCNLRSANFDGSCFEDATLWECDFIYAHLRGVNLTSADLTGSCLYEADLTGADLTGADLTSVDMRGVTGVAHASVTDPRGYQLLAVMVGGTPCYYVEHEHEGAYEGRDAFLASMEARPDADAWRMAELAVTALLWQAVERMGGR